MRILKEKRVIMNYFRYKAEDREGKITRGIRMANNAATVLSELKSQGVKVLNLRPLRFTEIIYYRAATLIYEIRYENGIGGLFGRILQKKRSRARPYINLENAPMSKDKVSNFTRELGILLRAGVQLEKALTIIADSEIENPVMQNVSYAILKDVLSGHSFSSALSKYRRVFPDEYIGLVRAGEETGKMADVLDALSFELERDDRLHKRVRASLVYPAFILLIAILCILGIFLYIFPRIAVILIEMKVDFPLCTSILIFLIQALTNPYVILVTLILGVILFYQLRLYLGTPIGKYNYGAFKFTIPLFGTLSRWLFTEKFCRTMGMFFKFGVPLTTSLKVMKDVFGNPFLSDHVFGSIFERVRQGEDLDAVLRTNPEIPKIAASLVSVGVESGELVDCLYKAADIFALEIEQMIQKLISLIEPIIVFVLGMFILFAILSIFLPLYQAISALGSE